MHKALQDRDWWTQNLRRSDVTDKLTSFFAAELAKSPVNVNAMAQIFTGAITGGAQGVQRATVASVEEKFAAMVRQGKTDPERFVSAACALMKIPTLGLFNYLGNRSKRGTRGTHKP
jgi:hypothetical protein